MIEAIRLTESQPITVEDINQMILRIKEYKRQQQVDCREYFLYGYKEDLDRIKECSVLPDNIETREFPNWVDFGEKGTVWLIPNKFEPIQYNFKNKCRKESTKFLASWQLTVEDNSRYIIIFSDEEE